MKILLVHYRYFISGGPERYLFNIMEVLRKNGHEVIPFSIKHDKNHTSDYEEYFLTPLGSGKEVYGHEYKRTFKTVVKVIERMIYSFEAKRKIKHLINLEKPDVIYILQYQNKMSTSVIDAAYSTKTPIVQRISDFAHICINNTFYRYKQQEICEKCLHGRKINSVIHKCFYDSYIDSFIKYLSLKVQDLTQTHKKISAYIIPSKFTATKFSEFGIERNKIFHIPTFFNMSTIISETIQYKDYALYVGRVDQDKGLMTLVKAFENTERKLYIIGSSSSNYDTTLTNYLRGKQHNIKFLGKLEFDQIQEYYKNCLFTICPSEWYDNFPNTILESFAFKKMVVASKIGSLTELVEENISGLLFKAGNPSSLRERCEIAFSNTDNTKALGENGYFKVSNDYCENVHYEKLLSTFNYVLNGSYK